MRWFKHLSCSSEDPKITLVLDKFGAEGYGIFWIVLEKIALEMKEDDHCEVTYSLKTWSKAARTSQQRFTIVAKFFHKIGLLVSTFDEDRLTIKCPNLLKYRDEYKRKRDKKSGQTPDNVRTISGHTPDMVRQSIETDTETDTDTEKETPPLPPISYPVVKGGQLESVKNFGKEFEDYLEPLSKYFPVIEPTKSITGMFHLWQDRKVIRADVEAAVRANQAKLADGTAGHPTFLRPQVLNYAAFRLRGNPYPCDHNSDEAQLQRFLAKGE